MSPPLSGDGSYPLAAVGVLTKQGKNEEKTGKVQIGDEWCVFAKLWAPKKLLFAEGGRDERPSGT